MPTIIESEGFYEMSAADYHADPCPSPSLSSSIAWDIEPSNVKAGSPEYGFHSHPKLGGKSKDATDEMRFGSLCHSILLGVGSDFEVGPYSDYRKKEAQTWRDEVILSGKIPIKQNESDECRDMVAIWKDQIHEAGLSKIFDAQKEQVIAWKEGDLWCRSMLDLWLPDCGEIWDFKTTTSVHPKKIIRKVCDEGLPLRSEFYKRGVEKLKPEYAGKLKFGFIFLSTKFPYSVLIVHQLNGQFRHIGKSQVQRSIDTFSNCLKTNNWPGYEPIQQLECPHYAFMEEITEEDDE